MELMIWKIMQHCSRSENHNILIKGLLLLHIRGWMGHIQSKKTEEHSNQQKNTFVLLQSRAERAPLAVDQSTLCEEAEKSVRVNGSGLTDYQGENGTSQCLDEHLDM